MVQQPPGHVVASQVQVPLVVSHRPFEHGEQVAPAVPQDVPDCEPHGSHVPVGPPLQQPLGHEVASQMQLPLVLSQSRLEPHAPQVAPAVPHDCADSDAQGSQVPEGPPLQQPLGHEVASHTQLPVELHSVPDGHALHATPALPHELVLSLA
jgi:hypothetical protein